MPRGLATPWTKGGQKQVDALTKGREVREIKDLDTAKGVKGQLEATSVKVPAKAGQSGRLFGAVTTATSPLPSRLPVARSSTSARSR